MELGSSMLPKWVGLAYAGVVLVFLLANADDPMAVLLTLVFIPWIVGPAAVAALGARFSRSARAAWAFFGLMVLGSGPIDVSVAI